VDPEYFADLFRRQDLMIACHVGAAPPPSQSTRRCVDNLDTGCRQQLLCAVEVGGASYQYKFIAEVFRLRAKNFDLIAFEDVS
jgi:hypothetical protein